MKPWNSTSCIKFLIRETLNSILSDMNFHRTHYRNDGYEVSNIVFMNHQTKNGLDIIFSLNVSNNPTRKTYHSISPQRIQKSSSQKNQGSKDPFQNFYTTLQWISEVLNFLIHPFGLKSIDFKLEKRFFVTWINKKKEKLKS